MSKGKTEQYYQKNTLKDIITTPYLKVLNVLNNAKKYINIVSKNQSKLIRDLEWAMRVITSHSLYTYELADKELLDKYQQDNPEFKHFIDFVSDYNEEVIEVNKKNTFLLSKTTQMSNELNLLQTPSLNIKKLPINNPILKKKSINNLNFLKNKTVNFSNVSLYSLKQIMKNDTILSYKPNNFNINKYITIVNKDNINQSKINHNINNFKLRKSIQMGRKVHNLSGTSIGNRNTEGSEDCQNTRKRLTSAESSHGKVQKYSFMYIEGIITKANYDVKKIITKEFNIFELKDLIGHENVLPLMGKTILDTFGINDKMINMSKLDSFLISLSNSYCTNVLYHNAIHGADVTHTVSLFFLNSNAEEVCETKMLDILSILIASLGHDIGHPGLTNGFQINSNSKMALTYNDISCLENYHSAKFFKLVREPENNIFEKLNVNDYKMLRKRMVSMILATDMANHGKILSIIKGRIKLTETENGEQKLEILTKNPKTQFEEQQALLDYFIHSADIAHNTKQFTISLQWVELLSNEFWLQGDQEKKMNLPVSFLCERMGADIPNSQIGFIKGFIIPTFDVLIQMFPSLSYTMENAKNNLDNWQKLADQHRKTGWTPRDSNKDMTRKENDPNEKKDNKDNINGKINNNINKSNAIQIKKNCSAIWGKSKLIIVNKRSNSNEKLIGNKK